MTLGIPNISNEARIAIIRWMLGGIVRHQPCLNCDNLTELSRTHALHCSGANDFLRNNVGSTILPEAGETLLDAILNRYRNQNMGYRVRVDSLPLKQGVFAEILP